MTQAKLDGVNWKIRVVFLSGETLFLRRTDDLAFPQQGGGGIMIEGRYAQNNARRGHGLEKRIEGPGNARTGGENQDGANEQQKKDERKQPPFFLLLQKTKKF